MLCVVVFESMLGNTGMAAHTCASVFMRSIYIIAAPRKFLLVRALLCYCHFDPDIYIAIYIYLCIGLDTIYSTAGQTYEHMLWTSLLHAPEHAPSIAANFLVSINDMLERTSKHVKDT